MGSIHLVSIDLPEGQIAMVKSEVDTTLLGLAGDLAYLDGKPNPQQFISEVAAYARLATYLHSGTARLPDRAARKALRRLAKELDSRNEYDRVVAEHDAFEAFGETMRAPAAGASKERR
jgi:hypothetical protein